MIVCGVTEGMIIKFKRPIFRKIGDLEVDENQHFRPRTITALYICQHRVQATAASAGNIGALSDNNVAIGVAPMTLLTSYI